MADIENGRNYMLRKNEEQKKYYEFDSVSEFSLGSNIITRGWEKIRGYQYDMARFIDLGGRMSDIHLNWMGDLSDKKVLDLGCFLGNELTFHLAEHSREFIGLDLSASAMEELRKKFEARGLVKARTMAVDFLSDDFTERDFDVVYAKSIFHHFKYIDVFLERLRSIMKPGGIVITVDPLNTYLPLKIIRAIYRPFQNDKDWEYPFTKETIRTISRYFEIDDTIGLMGRLKYALPVYIFSKEKAKKLSETFMKKDFEDTDFARREIWKCMRISMLLHPGAD